MIEEYYKLRTDALATDDFFPLSDKSQYGLYFSILTTIVGLLEQCIQKAQVFNEWEQEAVHTFLRKLLTTINLLGLKSTYDTDRSLYIDLKDSGFFNLVEIAQMSVDCINKASYLKQARLEQGIKKEICEYLFTNGGQPMGLLKELSRRVYMERININNIFTRFTSGQLVTLRKQPQNGMRSYGFSWGSYDVLTNLPYFYIVWFDYSHKLPLESNKQLLEEFTEIVKKETFHGVQKILVPASEIDKKLDYIHPKVFKRFTIGPVYSELSRHNPKIFSENFKHVPQHNRYVCSFMLEVLRSGKQNIESRILRSPKRTEIFEVADAHTEAGRLGVTAMKKFIIIPHALQQLVKAYFNKQLKDRFTYIVDNKGGIHEG